MAISSSTRISKSFGATRVLNSVSLDIAMVFQYCALYPSMSARENNGLPLYRRRSRAASLPPWLSRH
jgi:hypothetical protein